MRIVGIFCAPRGMGMHRRRPVELRAVGSLCKGLRSLGVATGAPRNVKNPYRIHHLVSTPPAAPLFVLGLHARRLGLQTSAFTGRPRR